MISDLNIRIQIRPLKIGDVSELKKLFEKTIYEIFERNNIEDKKELEQEINDKIFKVFKSIIEEESSSNFYVAEKENTIIGIAGLSLINSDIESYIEINENAYELGTVYVLPEFQRKGIGSLLINTVIENIKNLGIHEFYLDCGYRTSQSYWIEKFGKPYINIENKFGKNQDYMIWKVKTKI